MVVVADNTIFLVLLILRFVEVDVVPISDFRSSSSNRLSTCILYRVSSEIVALLSFSLQLTIVKTKNCRIYYNKT